MKAAVADPLLFQRIGLGVLEFIGRLGHGRGPMVPRRDVSSARPPGHVVLVSSARAGEGKSFVAQGLAAALADQQEGDVAWVDALNQPTRDPASAQAAAALSEGAAPGASQHLALEAFGPDRLWRSHSGLATGAGLLHEPEAVARGLGALRARFALIVVDGPALAQCGALLGHVDACVMVVDARRTSGRVARRALASARLSTERLAGMVLNHRPRPVPRWLARD